MEAVELWRRNEHDIRWSATGPGQTDERVIVSVVPVTWFRQSWFDGSDIPLFARRWASAEVSECPVRKRVGAALVCFRLAGISSTLRLAVAAGE